MLATRSRRCAAAGASAHPRRTSRGKERCVDRSPDEAEPHQRAPGPAEAGDARPADPREGGVAGLAVGLAAALTPTLVGLEKWSLLVAIWAITGILVATYATGRGLHEVPRPGVLLLVCFVVYPIVLTAQLSTTNYGDGTRGTKEEAIAQIIGASVKQTADAPRYNLSVATTGSVTEGLFVFLLVDQETEEAYVGDAEGLEPFPDATVTDGFVTEALGFTLLTPVQVNDAQQALADFVVPTDGGAIRQLGIREAFEGKTTLEYDEATDTITDTETGTEYTRSSRATGSTSWTPRERVADQSWQANVGLDNYKRIFTDDRISSDFLRIFLWTLVFAFLSVATTFLLGLGLAATLSDPRVRGQKYYRAILVLPYAIPDSSRCCCGRASSTVTSA